MLRNRFAPLRPFALAMADCWLMCMDSGVVGAVCGVVARAQEEKNRSGSGRALPPRLFRPRPKSFGRSAIEAFASNRPKENTPSTPVAAARLFAKRPNAFVGVFCLPWVFAPLRFAHIVSLCPCPPRRCAPAPPSLPSVAARGLCVRPRGVVCVCPSLFPRSVRGRGVRSSPRSSSHKATRVRGLMSLAPRPLSPLGVGMVLVSVCLLLPLYVCFPPNVCFCGLVIATRKKLECRLAPRVCGLPRP